MNQALIKKATLRQVQIDNAFVSRVCSETADQRTKIGSNQPLTIQTVSVQSSICLSLSAMMKASLTTLLDSRLVVSFLCSERCNNIDSSGTGGYYLEPLAVALDKEKWSMIGSLHVFTNVSDGYDSSSDQESYSETSSGKLSKIDNAFVSRVCLETAALEKLNVELAIKKFPPTPDEISFAREGNEIPIEAALEKPKKSITENNSVQGFDQKN
ncbi:hypothetical protein F2Q69_00053118 [Brassica cretica]|uniref:Uncharacterized protein n=1 Tax=Brassica cretica TaxID=69181 RepID=A0A8S9MYV4_BRACR|nr:hypothetical protein F2Q69_00053118 [Brassica cretica]